MMNGKPCCLECANGTKFCPGEAVQNWRETRDFEAPAAGVTAGLTGRPITFIDASIECQTKDYDPRVSKSFRIV
jgi:hypothetical protein